ncbi:unnamed protein product [Notodromas monacha]|uniref:GT23 domain-containing protein n=1 Tax=Notodromas monacha TaxID=399045 RepID=A0A7R9BDH5_9CRUS|nr:unnamed protein product [Notodromas monacha]CAG0913374.1 unnamed protein product [Notodromas monacha]
MRNFRYFAFLICVVWLCGTILFIFRSPNGEAKNATALEPVEDGTLSAWSSRISAIQSQLHDMRVERDNILALLNDCSHCKKGNPSFVDNQIVEKTSSGGFDLDTIPGPAFESARRGVEEQIRELWWFLSNELKALKSDVGNAAKNRPQDALVHSLENNVEDLLKLSTDRFRVLQRHVKRLKEDSDQKGWREQEALELSSLVQRRLDYLQNPMNCRTAKKLVCTLSKACGYGCQLHHLVYCLIMAYSSQRTLILRSQGWRYSKKGWESLFLPLSRTCNETNTQNIVHWRDSGNENDQEVLLPIIDAMKPRVPQLPLSVPVDLFESLKKFHGDPPAWWIGQMIFFLTRYQPDTDKFITENQIKIGFHTDTPIVGVHIRRTDKVGSEAAFHSVDEYMVEVEDWFQNHDVERYPLAAVPRRVYVASDDPEVFKVLQRSYPAYEVIGSPDISKTAALNTRYSHSSVMGVIFDIHNLARTDFLVCTFSSQVCRAAYEAMQSVNVDASNRFKSLDDIYYYGGQNGHKRRAVFPHHSANDGKHSESSPLRGEIDFVPGDLIGIAGNHWNGYSVGTNDRSGHKGLFPTYKTEEVVQVADFPIYPEVPRRDPSKELGIQA